MSVSAMKKEKHQCRPKKTLSVKS